MKCEMTHEVCHLEEECLDVVSPAVWLFRMPTGSRNGVESPVGES